MKTKDRGARRRFHISDVLSITHDRLVSTRHMDGVYDICNFLTQDNLFTHQLPRVHAECKAWLFELHPQLMLIPPVTDEEASKLKNGKPVKWWEAWVELQAKEYGEFLDVTPIPRGRHQYRNPIEEAVEMMGADRVTVVNVGDADRAPESAGSPNDSPVGGKSKSE